MSQLSDALTDEQKRNKTGNLLTQLRRSGEIHNAGSRTRPRWELSLVRTDPMGLTKDPSKKGASQDVEMTGQRDFSPSLGCAGHRQSSGGVVAAGKRRVVGPSTGSTVRRPLLNCHGDAKLGAYHLPPLGAGFFMPADPSLRSVLEAKR